MNRLLVRLYVVCSIIVFLGITAFFFFDLYQIRERNERLASTAFSALAVTIEDAWNRQPLPEAGDTVIETVERENIPMPLVISVYSFDIGIDYLWAVDDRFVQGDLRTSVNSPPVISTNELVHTRYSRSFRLSNGQRRIVTAVYSVLDENSIYPTLRVTFILVLGFVSLVLLLAIVHSIGSGSRQKSNSASRGQKPTSNGTEVAPSGKTPRENGRIATEIATGTHKTTSGLVPEDGLARRVTLELERAAFHEQDLSVALFRFSAGTRGDEMYRRNAAAILAFFSFEDLCFEKGDEDIAVVFPATTLNDTLGQIERFQRFYWEERNNWNQPEADFLVGVSARNGRLVEGERIMRECSIACSKAKTTPGRIMGFQPDPQRYRAYLLDRK